MVIDPGFITKRDYCIATRADAVKHEIEWHQVDCPKRPGRSERMVTNRGAWKITAHGQGSSVIYFTHADPGGLLPAWLVNTATARRVPKILAALRRVLHNAKVTRR